jgi:hypothetical protein
MCKTFLSLIISLGFALPCMGQDHKFRVLLDQVRVLKTRETSGDRPYFAFLKFKSRLLVRNSSEVQVKLFEPHDWVSKPQYNRGILRLNDHMSRGEMLALPWWNSDFTFTSTPLAQTSIETLTATINGLIIISLDNNNTPPHVVRNLISQVSDRLKQILREQVESGVIIRGINPSSPEAFHALSNRVMSFSSSLTNNLDVNIFDWTFGSTFNPDKITGIHAFIFPSIAGLHPQISEYETSIVSDTIKIRSWFGTPVDLRQNIIFEGSGARYEVPLRFSTLSLASDIEVPRIRVKIKTGGDDLRRTSIVNLRLYYQNDAGETHHDLVVHRFGGWGNNSDNVVELELPRGIKRRNIRRAELRFRSMPDGPFSSPDNWNLDALSIELMVSSNLTELLYNGFGAPLFRFTGSNPILPLTF